MVKTRHGVRDFGFRDKLGYLFGDFGNDFTFLLSSSFLLKFYTDVMGIAPWIVGVIMTVARFVDAFTDVTMGRICDRAKYGDVGKFKPWILRMCGPVAIASFLIYQSSLSDMPTAFKVVWLSVTYILWGSVFYTSINIPYGSMASAITGNPEERQSLSTFRSMGSALAGLIVGAGVPLFAYDDINGATVLNGTRFTVIAGIFSILSIVCYLLCYFLCTERIERKVEVTQHGSIVLLLKRAIKNPALLSIIAASVVMLLSQLTLQSMSNYVYPNYYGNVEAQSVSTVVMVLSLFVAAAVAKPLSRKFGKAEISAVSSLAAAGVSFILFLIRPSSVWAYVAVNAVAWLGLGVFTMVSWALVTDVIDDAELRNGVREDGSIYALYSFARKLGQAAAAGISGALLSAIGYSDETAFLPSVVNGIYNISTLLPAIGFTALGLILWLWYPLKRKTVLANSKFLEEKHRKI